MNWTDTRLCGLLGVKHPIIQAPMAGGSSPQMAAAAGNAGALGSMACAYDQPDRVRANMAELRRLGEHPVNLNFFAHAPPRHDARRNARAMARLERWYRRLNAGSPQPPAAGPAPFGQAMCATVLALRPEIVSFHFGLPAPGLLAQLKAVGTVVLSCATSVAEARYLEDHGVDAIIAQGHEAGGHSGWFLERDGAEVAGCMALVPRIVDAVALPVIAAGGIADGRGIAAALMLGAAGVQIGTAFLASSESRISAPHRAALLAASGDDTMLCDAFSGRKARTVVNAFARDMAELQGWPDFPLMNSATAPLRAASVDADAPDAIALWSGQAVGLIRAETTADILARLVAETGAVMRRVR